MSKKMTKEYLLRILKEWIEENGKIPSKREFIKDKDTPSDMPYRKAFGSWGNALKELGYEPLKPRISELAKENSIKSRKGKTSPNSKGGRIKNKQGYIQMWMPNHPNASKKGYVLEHRYLVSENIGRPLYGYEDVHHINGIKDDNDLNNLELLTKSEHARRHVDNKDEYFSKNRMPCIYPNCESHTLSKKYQLCNKHYRSQWRRVKDGLVENILDIREISNKHSEETKKRLSKISKMQPRKNGRFSIKNPELLKEEVK